MSRARDIANFGDGLTASEIPNLSASKITSGTFATARIADDAINLDKLAHLGTDGHVLTSTGTGSAPAFEAVPASSNLVMSANSVSCSSSGTGAEFTGLNTSSKIIIVTFIFLCRIWFHKEQN